MLESDAQIDQDSRNTEHELWLAMQAAHNQYYDATAALDALTSEAPDSAPSREGNLAIEQMAKQRTAFENYIEARLQFSEYLLGRPDPGRLSVGHSNTRRPWAFTASRLARLAVALALLCPTAFSLAYLAHQRNQVRDLNVARDEMSATLDQARHQIQTLARKLDAANTTEQLAIRQSCSTPAATALPRSAAARGHWRRLQTPPSKQTKQVLSPRKPAAPDPRGKLHSAVAQRGRPVAMNHKELVQLEKRGERNYYEFTLTPSTHFERIGPIGLSLRKVELKHKYCDLSVKLGDFKLDKNHVNLYEPVRINLNGHPAPVELVANRIDKDHIQGYLSEPK